jgi:hypothetical protein
MGIWIQTGREAFYWTITSVWTIVLGRMESVQHLVMITTRITVFLGLHLIREALTTTTIIVIHFVTTTTALWSAVGMIVPYKNPYQLQLQEYK